MRACVWLINKSAAYYYIFIIDIYKAYAMWNSQLAQLCQFDFFFLVVQVYLVLDWSGKLIFIFSDYVTF